MDVAVFLFAVFALVAGISNLTGAKMTWHRPARGGRSQLREPQWLRNLSGLFLVLYALVSFIGVGAGWFR